MSDDDWRRRRAEQLYDGEPIPPSSHEIRPRLTPVAAPPRPAVAPPPVAAAPPPVVAAPPPGIAAPPPVNRPSTWPQAQPRFRAVRVQPPGARRAALPWLAGTAAAAIAAVVGWLAHDLSAPRVPPLVAASRTGGAASVAVPPPPVAPIVIPPRADAPPREPAREVPAPRALGEAAGDPLAAAAPTPGAGEIDAATLDRPDNSATAERIDAAPRVSLPSPAAPRRAAPAATAPVTVHAANKHAASPTLPRRSVAVSTFLPDRRRRDDRPLATTTGGPSFNCRRAHAMVNRMICANPDLAALDRTLAATYRRADRSRQPYAAEQLHDDETEFLNRRQNCRTPECVARLYRDRIDEIEGGR